MNIITWAHLIGTLGMFGVILFVQIVHYPLMARVREERFGEYARAHTARTGLVVGPLMIPEFGAALWLALIPLATPTLNLLAWIGLALLILIWAVTGLVSVPCHSRLMRGFDAGVHRRLVSSNWIRTALWAIRVPIALWLAGVPVP